MKTGTLLIILCAVAVAQSSSDNAPDIGQRWKQNAETLREYSYHRRTEVRVKGQVRGSRVDLVRYVNGQKETVPLESPQHGEGGGGGRGGLRGRMVQKKKEEMKEEVERMAQLLESYLLPKSGMREILEKATISRTGSDAGAAVQATAKGIVEPSDSLILTWSVANQRPEKIEVRTELDGKPVEAAVDFAALPQGPFYAARTIVSAPKKDLVIEMDEFEFTRGGEDRR